MFGLVRSENWSYFGVGLIKSKSDHWGLEGLDRASSGWLWTTGVEQVFGDAMARVVILEHPVSLNR